MNKLILLYGIAFCLLSCNGNRQTNYPRYSSFEKEETLYAETITLDSVFFRYPYRVSVKGNIALVLDLHNNNHFFHAFTYPGWKHLVSFGKRGQAPEEILSAETFRFCSPDSIWVLDANKMEITRWEIDTMSRRAIRVEAISLEKQLIRTLDFYPVDSGFMVPDYTGEHRYGKIDRQGKILSFEESIPTEQTYTTIALPVLAQAWRSFMDYHPKHQLLVLATQLGEVLELYNLRDGTKKVLYGPAGEPRFQFEQGEAIPTGIMGFSDVKITKRFIYTVFHGRSFKEIAEAYSQGIMPEDGGHFLYVYDLQGKPMCKYKLDHAIYGFDILEETGTLLGTDVNSDNPLVVYHLPSLYSAI